MGSEETASRIPGSFAPEVEGALSRYIPLTRNEEARMLAVLGLKDEDELFSMIPRTLKSRALFRDTPLMPLSELSVVRALTKLAGKNLHADRAVCFLGGGSYDHYVPAAIRHLILRSEIYTAYTPYQPEVSQGTLQAIFEFQSFMCALTGMKVSNASHYDGATALAEAVLMALRASRKKEILVSEGVNPRHRKVLMTYLKSAGESIQLLKLSPDGRTQVPPPRLLSETAALVLGYPNYLGVIEDLKAFRSLLPDGCLIISANPMALSILKSPGELGANIVVGDGLCLGGPMGYGGPGLGIMAVDGSLLRQIPGRIVGKTLDKEGKEAYVLTLQAREQHIRRQKAFSNICTNQTLLATVATIYLSLLGKQGLKRVGEENFHNAHYLRKRIEATLPVKGFTTAPYFNEFALDLKTPPGPVLKKLVKEGFLGGVDLSTDYPAFPTGILVAATECRTKDEMDAYVEALGRCL